MPHKLPEHIQVDTGAGAIVSNAAAPSSEIESAWIEHGVPPR
jgi:hypothetical protein